MMKINKLVEKGLKTLEEKLKGDPSAIMDNFFDYVLSFYNYSYFNQFLIFWQKPTASLVAGFRAWQKRGRYVKRGEKGIGILVPYYYKATKKDKDGELVEFDKLYFKTGWVFDVTQTGGEPLPPSPWEQVFGDIGNVLPYALQACPFDIFVDELGTDSGRLTWSGCIVLNKSVSDEVLFASLIHEWTHGILHYGENLGLTVAEEELEAEIVSYLVTKFYGLENPGAIDYLKEWQASPGRIKKSMKRISFAISLIIKAIEEELGSGKIKGMTRGKEKVSKTAN